MIYPVLFFLRSNLKQNIIQILKSDINYMKIISKYLKSLSLLYTFWI